VSERTFRRWRDRYEQVREVVFWTGGSAGRRAGGSGRPGGGSGCALSRALPGFPRQTLPRAFGEGSRFRLGSYWTKLHVKWKRLVAKAPRKGAHRRKRERRPLPGMMLHQDGSRHEWLEGQPPLDLIVTLDDATGAIYSAFLIEEEGTASTFRALRQVFPEEHGLADEPLRRSAGC
jgi:hypothetical protein